MLEDCFPPLLFGGRVLCILQDMTYYMAFLLFEGARNSLSNRRMYALRIGALQQPKQVAQDASNPRVILAGSHKTIRPALRRLWILDVVGLKTNTHPIRYFPP